MEFTLPFTLETSVQITLTLSTGKKKLSSITLDISKKQLARGTKLFKEIAARNSDLFENLDVPVKDLLENSTLSAVGSE